MIQHCNFSYNHYQVILQTMLQNGYSYSLFGSKVEHSGCTVYLRHDIDIDLTSAKRLAEIEINNGVRATYFVFLASPFYNSFERESAETIKYIASLGHQMGLHFDNSTSADYDITKITRNIYGQVEALEMGLRIKIKTISFHRPSKAILESNLILKNIENVYHEKYFKRIKYISDSRQIWQESCPCQILNKRSYSHLQILFHPVWWTDEGGPAQICLEKFLLRSSLGIDENLLGNISVYRSMADHIYGLTIGGSNG